MSIKNLLLLSGGGSWGIFQIKVLKDLLKNKKYDFIYGSSVGALNGYYLSQYPINKQLEGIDNLHNIWMNNKPYNKSNFRMISGFFSNGIYDTTPLKNTIDKFTLPINDNVITPEFKFVVTDSKTFHPKYITNKLHKNNPELYREYLLASASIPIIFPTLTIDNNNYFDGCFSNHLSNLILPYNNHIHIDYITTYTDDSYSRYELEFDFTNGNVISKLNNLVMHMIQKKQNIDYLLFSEKIKNSNNNISFNKYYITKNEKLQGLKNINFYDFNKDIFIKIYNLDYRV